MAELPVFRTSQPGGLLGLVNKEFHPGSVFFVGAAVTGATDSSSYGRDPEAPFATLDYAIASCTADKGDKVYVLPGHTETVSGSIALDIADMSVIGLGQGQNKPTITFDNTAGELNPTADDVTVKGVRFVSDVNSLVNFVDADGNNLVLDGCEWITSAAKEALCFINFATTKDYLAIRNCLALQPSDPEGTDQAAGTGFLYCVDTENIIIEDNIFLGSFETAIIHNKTTACKNLYTRRNIFRQDLATALHYEIVAGATGHSRADSGHNINAADATPATCIGTYGTLFWFGTDSQFSNDSGGGGQGMIASESATS